MATLNVKNLPQALYRKLQAQARRQRRSVAQEVTRILEQALEQPQPLSILDLRGLGRERWKKMGGGRHVEKERRAWD